MRKAVIDLDWLEDFLNDQHYDLSFRGALEMVKKHCTPIEEPFTFVDTSIKTNNESILKVSGRINEKYSGRLYEETFLSKTCINNWESNNYCSSQNKCEMCKIKK